MSVDVPGRLDRSLRLHSRGILAALLASGPLGCASDTASHAASDGFDSPPAGSTATSSVEPPAEWLEAQISNDPFQIRIGDGGWPRLDNPAHDLSLELGPGGYTRIFGTARQDAPLVGRSSGSLSLETVSWGRPGDLRAPAWAPAVIGACADDRRTDSEGDCLRRAERRGDGLLEWWGNRPEGLEQGWTVTEIPAGDGPLVLEISVSGARVEQGEGEVRLWTGPGSWLNYGHAAAWDDRGTELPAWIEGDEVLLRVVVDDALAVGPIHIDPLLASPTWTLDGNLAGLSFGATVAAVGDVNGDGFGDVLVGAPSWDNGHSDEGRALLYLGSATGLATTPAWTAESNHPASSYGASLGSAGDVNGDGYGDVVVGAYTLANGQTMEGKAFVYFGADFGLWPSANWTTEGNQIDANLGYVTTSAGDVNSDGFADLLLTATGWDGTFGDEGAAFVYLGGASGPATTASWTATPGQSAVLFGLGADGAGDVNGDGYGDVVVGGRLYDNGNTNEGAVFVYHGSSGGLPALPSTLLESNSDSAYFGANVAAAGDVNGDGYADVLAYAMRYDLLPSFRGTAYLHLGGPGGLTPVASWTVTGEQASEYRGSVLGTAGDVNADGYADILIGAPSRDNGQGDEGAAWLYLGSATGPGSVANWAVESNQVGATLASGLAGAGDINGDGLADVILGAAGMDNGQIDEGQVQLFFGQSATPSTTALWSLEGNQSNARMGSAMGPAGDVNGDGLGDVLVGANYYDNGQTDEGRALLFLGTTSGLSTVPTWTREGNQTNTYFGGPGALTGVGDVNADGYGDVVVGSFLYDAEFAEGTAQLFLGSASGLGTSVAWTSDGDQPYAYWGSEVARAGDVNGDGYDDVLIGANLYDNGQTDEGRAALYLGSATGLPTTPAWINESNVPSANYGGTLAAGDWDGDGLSDVAVGGDNYDNNTGAIWVYMGAASGLATTASAFIVGGQSSSAFGASMASAGDVNADGYTDLIVGSPGWDNGDPDVGQAQVFHGSVAGLSTSAGWTVTGTAPFRAVGQAVASAGDLDADGDADVLLGSGQIGDGYGEISAYLGSPAGLATTAAWAVLGTQLFASYGSLVAGLGDVNGDGYPEVGVTSIGYDNPNPNEGAAWLFSGNTGDGTGLHPRPAVPQARRSLIGLPISPGLRSGTDGSFYAEVATARSPFGRGGVRLAVEAKALGTPFDGTGITRSSTWADSSPTGAPLSQVITNLSPTTGYHWRARVEYHPAEDPTQLWSPWLTGGLSGVPLGNHLVPGDNDADNDGYPVPGDCDDSRASVHPGAAEDCDGSDTDCVGGIPSNEVDLDNDQYIGCVDFLTNTTATNAAGEPLIGGSDCLDTSLSSNAYSGAVHPNATESCDGFDTDCVGGIPSSEVDDDNDQHVECSGFVSGSTATNSAGETLIGGADCLDTPLASNSYAADVRPGAPESCDGYNTDCSPMASVSPEQANEQDPDSDRYLSCASFVATTTATSAQALSLLGGSDCDDTTLAVHPGATEIVGNNIDENCDTDEICYVDADNDGYRLDTTVNSANSTCTDSGEAVATDATGECNDADPAIHPGALEGAGDGVDQNCDGAETCYVDNDNDGVRLTATSPSVDPDCADPGEAVAVDPTGDCNDNDSTILPGATELAGDGVDQNCDGTELCYVDADDDSHRLSATTLSTDGDCGDADEAVTGDPAGDCDDNEATIYPGAPESCDGVDQDCDGDVVEAFTNHDLDALPDCADVDDDDDLDPDTTDCEDLDSSVYTGAPEQVDDGVDQDCSGSDTVTCFVDLDLDAWGDSTTQLGPDGDCDDSGESSVGGDCDDDEPTTYPSAPELCDAVDSDCDATLVDGVPDTDTDGDPDCIDDDDDGDGFLDSADCGPLDADVQPGAVESCDGLDSDCDGSIVDEDLDSDGDLVPDCVDIDLDGDGWGAATDCEDENPSIHPTATEVPDDGVDQDCSGADTVTCATDGDGDGVGGASTTPDEDGNCADDPGQATTGDDCNDADATIYPGAPELPDDSTDQDCSGSDTVTCFVDGDLDLVGGTLTTLDDDGVCDDFGQSSLNGDCEDGDSSIAPGAVETCDTLDANCDGSLVDGFEDTDLDLSPDCIDPDDDGDLDPDTTDCGPLFADIWTGAPETCDLTDSDCDGSLLDGEPDVDGDMVPDCADGDVDGDGYDPPADCDGLDASIHPGATEDCDGVDSDCDASLVDGYVDTDLDAEPDCVDSDDDGDADPDATDCADQDATVYTAAAELCDLVDSDCDGSVVDEDADGDLDGVPDCTDVDDDGDGAADVVDCGQFDPTIAPLAVETADDGIDQDCDGTDTVSCLVDGDGDGAGGGVTALDGDGSCTDAGQSAVPGDCDDGDQDVHPGATEVCNGGVDDDCDPTTDEQADDDGDGTTGCDGDCDDADSAVHPGATELCDGMDGDCSGAPGDDEVDEDGDGSKVCEGDCDDNNADNHPGASELCDGLDNDCDDVPDAEEADFDYVEWFADTDGDGFGDPGAPHADNPQCGAPVGFVRDYTDCDDGQYAVHPGADELCNGLDDDCDDGVDLGGTDVDADGDGLLSCEGAAGVEGGIADCDDDDAAIFPGAEERCGDGIDQDCDGFETEGMDDPTCWTSGCTGSIVAMQSPGAGNVLGSGLLALLLTASTRRRRTSGRRAILGAAMGILMAAPQLAWAAEAAATSNVDVLRREVTEALGAARCAEARAAALQWTSIQPNDAAGWRALGDAARCAANHREAIVAYRRAASTGGNSPGLQDLIQLVATNLGAATVHLKLSKPVPEIRGRMLVGEEVIEPLSREADTLNFAGLPVDQPIMLVVEGKGLAMVKQDVAPLSPGENRTIAVQPTWVGLGTLAVGAYDKANSKVAAQSGGVEAPVDAGSEVEVTAGTVVLIVENPFGRTETKVEVRVGTRVPVEPGRFAPSVLRLVGVPAGAQLRVVVESIGEDIVEVVRHLPAGEGTIDPETGLRLAPPQEFRSVPGGNGGVFVSHPVLGNGATTLVLLAGTENSARFPVGTLPGLARMEAAYKEWRSRTTAASLGKARSPVFAIIGGGLAGVSAVMFGAAVAADGRITAAKADAMGAAPGPAGREAVEAAWVRHVDASQERTALTVLGGVLSGVSAVAFGVTFGTVGAAKRAVTAIGPWDPSSVK